MPSLICGCGKTKSLKNPATQIFHLKCYFRSFFFLCTKKTVPFHLTFEKNLANQPPEWKNSFHSTILSPRIHFFYPVVDFLPISAIFLKDCNLKLLSFCFLRPVRQSNSLLHFYFKHTYETTQR